MDTERIVREHYGRENMETAVLDALRATGVDVDALRVEDLGGIDQLHAGFIPATDHLLEALDLNVETPLLDVGAGLGGPARVAAARYGCQVTGIDLSPDFVEVATNLTARVGLTDRVTFDVGSATAMPFGDGACTRDMIIHDGTHTPEKDRVFAEVRRVLRPDGRFA